MHEDSRVRAYTNTTIEREKTTEFPVTRRRGCPGRGWRRCSPRKRSQRRPSSEMVECHELSFIRFVCLEAATDATHLYAQPASVRHTELSLCRGVWRSGHIDLRIYWISSSPSFAKWPNCE